jgi:hypothetical protein
MIKFDVIDREYTNAEVLFYLVNLQQFVIDHDILDDKQSETLLKKMKKYVETQRIDE